MLSTAAPGTQGNIFSTLFFTSSPELANFVLVLSFLNLVVAVVDKHTTILGGKENNAL